MHHEADAVVRYGVLTRWAVQEQQARSASVFVYEFSHPTRVPGFADCLGKSCHTAELPYVFDNVSDSMVPWFDRLLEAPLDRVIGPRRWMPPPDDATGSWQRLYLNSAMHKADGALDGKTPAKVSCRTMFCFALHVDKFHHSLGKARFGGIFDPCGHP